MGERRQRQLSRCRTVHPRRAVIGAIGGDEEHSGPAQARYQRQKAVFRGAVGPVRVFQHDDCRAQSRGVEQDSAHRFERSGPYAPLVRIHAIDRVSLSCDESPEVRAVLFRLIHGALREVPAHLAVHRDGIVGVEEGSRSR